MPAPFLPPHNDEDAPRVYAGLFFSLPFLDYYWDIDSSRFGLGEILVTVPLAVLFAGAVCWLPWVLPVAGHRPLPASAVRFENGLRWCLVVACGLWLLVISVAEQARLLFMFLAWSEASFPLHNPSQTTWQIICGLGAAAAGTAGFRHLTRASLLTTRICLAVMVGALLAFWGPWVTESVALQWRLNWTLFGLAVYSISLWAAPLGLTLDALPSEHRDRIQIASSARVFGWGAGAAVLATLTIKGAFERVRWGNIGGITYSYLARGRRATDVRQAKKLILAPLTLAPARFGAWAVAVVLARFLRGRWKILVSLATMTPLLMFIWDQWRIWLLFPQAIGCLALVLALARWAWYLNGVASARWQRRLLVVAALVVLIASGSYWTAAAHEYGSVVRQIGELGKGWVGLHWPGIRPNLLTWGILVWFCVAVITVRLSDVYGSRADDGRELG